MSRIRGMRGQLASSIAVTCAAALALPLALSSDAMAAAAPRTAGQPTAGQPGAGQPAAERPGAAPVATGRAAVPGSTQSLPLTPLADASSPASSPSSPSSSATTDRTLPPAAAQGLARRDVRHFSLVGVVWDNPDAELHGRVQVRTRATGTTRWSGWLDVDTHNQEHAADPGTEERTSGRVRGSTAPLWVGASDGVEVRVEAEADGREGAGRADRAGDPLPRGLHVELVDPGAEPPPQGPEADAPRVNVLTAEAAASSAVNADLAPLGATEIPALSKKETEADLLAARGGAGADAVDQRAKPYIGARPSIVTRNGWGADEQLRERNFSYTKTVKAAFVHHTASGNNYACAQASSVIRSIYRYHVKSSGWRDIGYNFLVDKCGNIYEGRAGGVAKAVMGAHTLGFNSNSMGIAVLGSFGGAAPPAAAVTGIARLTAWKLGLFGANPKGKTYLVSGGGNLYRKGTNVRLNVISGHRDGFATECPGGRLYAKLGTARTTSARYQGR
ncbi:peptidoglycan recognition protein [Streptomyces fructofermentans]|uniref:peptidoglycan recognition protein n=1 Tax=Streptomyces fructofermentans TaxID=152141 RepID=UPI0037B52AF4